MKKLLHLCALVLLGLPAAAQVTAYQGFETTAPTTNWSYTTNPAPYHYASGTDVWKDTSALGQPGASNTSITAAAEGTRFWGMWDLENDSTASLGTPYYHFMDFAPAHMCRGSLFDEV